MLLTSDSLYVVLTAWKILGSSLYLWWPDISKWIALIWVFFYSLSQGFGESESCSVMSNSLRSWTIYSPWNSPGQNTGVGSLSLLQRIFPTQGWNPGLLHCRRILYQLSHKGSPWRDLVTLFISMIMSFSYKTFSCVISATLKGLLWDIRLVGLSSSTGHKNACVEVFLKLYL